MFVAQLRVFIFFYAAGPSTSDDQSESSFSDPQFGTRCPTLSTDDDPSVGADLSCQRGIFSRKINLKLVLISLSAQICSHVFVFSRCD